MIISIKNFHSGVLNEYAKCGESDSSQHLQQKIFSCKQKLSTAVYYNININFEVGEKIKFPRIV